LLSFPQVRLDSKPKQGGLPSMKALLDYLMRELEHMKGTFIQ
jgi:hypothetical protein